MKFSLALLGLLAMASFLLSCSDNSTTTSGASSVTTLSALPGATTPVSSAYSGAPLSGDNAKSVGAKVATTGQILQDVAIADFQAASTPSRPACEVTNMLRMSYEMASQPDKIKCYIGSIVDYPTDNGITAGDILTDGSYNYMTVVENSVPAGTVKFKLQKDAAGVVQAFEMFECMSGGGSQSGYISTTLSGTALTMLVKNINSWSNGGNTGNFSSHFTIDGTMNGTALTAKQMTSIFENAWTGSSFTGGGYGKVIVDEYASTFKVNAFMHEEGTGSWSYNSTNYGYAHTNDLQVYSVAQLINPTPGQLSTLALGDGSLKVIFNTKNKSIVGTPSVSDATACVGNNNPAGCWVQTNVSESAAWTGDDLENQTFASSSYAYDEVNASTPALTQADPDITFDSDEQWDCSTVPAGSEMITVNIGSASQTRMASCDTVYGMNQGQHIGCWQLDDRN